ncbi:hypothetical protein ACS0TY_030045 [Phlomoides rotata]
MKEWEKTLGRGTHLQRIAHQVYNLNQGGTYTWCWNKASDGYYTVKLAYLKNLVHSVANSSNRATNKAFEKLCRCWAPRRYTTMVWKLLKRRMTTKDNLRRRGIFCNDKVTCSFCKTHEENNYFLNAHLL